jgi:hypothetical protein
MVRVRSAEALDGFRLHLVLTDGSERVVDVSAYLHGAIYEPLRTDRALFEAVSVDPVFGTVVWPNGADIDPEVLLHGRVPAEPSAVTRR